MLSAEEWDQLGRYIFLSLLLSISSIVDARSFRELRTTLATALFFPCTFFALRTLMRS